MPNPAIQCIPPCPMVLPPWALSSTSTIYWSLWTTELLSSTAGSVVTKSTVLYVPQFTITEVPFWPITAMPRDLTIATVTAVQSIMPPSITLALPPTEAPVRPTTILPPASTTNNSQPSASFSISSDSVAVRLTIEPVLAPA